MAANVSRARPDAKEGARVYLRLRRYGPRGEGGLARYHSRQYGRLYKRDGIYPVDDQEQARMLLSTGAFEQIPADRLELAKSVAKTPRGVSLEERSRRQRRARARRRPTPLVEEAPTMSEDLPVDDGDGLEL